MKTIERRKKANRIGIIISIFCAMMVSFFCYMSFEYETKKEVRLRREGIETFGIVYQVRKNIVRDNVKGGSHTSISTDILRYDVETNSYVEDNYAFYTKGFLTKMYRDRFYGLKSGEIQYPFIGCVYRIHYIYDEKKGKMISKIFYDEPLYDSIFINDSLIYIAPPKEYYDIMNQERKNKNSKVFRKNNYQ